jgi:hypothetical protein
MNANLVTLERHAPAGAYAPRKKSSHRATTPSCHRLRGVPKFQNKANPPSSPTNQRMGYSIALASQHILDNNAADDELHMT